MLFPRVLAIISALCLSSLISTSPLHLESSPLSLSTSIENPASSLLSIHLLRTDQLISDTTTQHDEVLKRLSHVILSIELNQEEGAVIVGDKKLNLIGAEGGIPVLKEAIKIDAFEIDDSALDGRSNPQELIELARKLMPQGIVRTELTIKEEGLQDGQFTDEGNARVLMKTYSVAIRVIEIDSQSIPHEISIVVPVLRIDLTLDDESGKPVRMTHYAIGDNNHASLPPPPNDVSPVMEIDDYDQQRLDADDEDEIRPDFLMDEFDVVDEDSANSLHPIDDEPQSDGPPRRQKPEVPHQVDDHRSPGSSHQDHDKDDSDEGRPAAPYHCHPHHGPPHRHHHGPPPPPPAWILWIAEKLGVPPPPPPPHHHRHHHHHGPPHDCPRYRHGRPSSPPGSEAEAAELDESRRPHPFNDLRPAPSDAPPRGQLFHHHRDAVGNEALFKTHRHQHGHASHFLHSIHALFFVLATAISAHWGRFIFFFAQAGLSFFVVRRFIKRIRERRQRGTVRLEDEVDKETLLEKKVEVVVVEKEET